MQRSLSLLPHASVSECGPAVTKRQTLSSAFLTFWADPIAAPAFFQLLEAAGNRLDLGEKVICEGGDRAKSEPERSARFLPIRVSTCRMSLPRAWPQPCRSRPKMGGGGKRADCTCTGPSHCCFKSCASEPIWSLSQESGQPHQQPGVSLSLLRTACPIKSRPSRYVFQGPQTLISLEPRPLAPSG